MKYLIYVLLLCVATVAVVGYSETTTPVKPQAVVLKASADALLDEDRPKNNMGASAYAAKVASFRNRGFVRILLVRFDLASVKSNDVKKATLRLFCPPSGWDHSYEAKFLFFAMKKPWVEGSGTDTIGSETGDGATWASYDGKEPWDGGRIASGKQLNSPGNFDDASFAEKKHTTYEEWLGTWIEVDATALVKEWLSGDRENHGVAVCGQGTAEKNAYTMFATREFKRDGFKAGEVAAQLIIE